MKSFWKDRNVFVTGAMGFLGSWLAPALVKQGAQVVVLCRDRIPDSPLLRSEVFSKVRVVCGDVTDLELMLRVLNEYEVTDVIHLAAQALVGTAHRQSLSTFESNIKGTWILLEAAKELKTVERILIASSDKAYGDHLSLPYREDFELRATNPYDVSKACADMLGQSYAKTYGLPIIITRCGNLYGGGDLNRNRIIPETIHATLKKKAIELRSTGDAVRDYVYVEDAVDAILHLMAFLPKEHWTGEAFNISADCPVRVTDLVKQILDIMDATHLKPIVRGDAMGEIHKQILSSEKLKTLTGWEAGTSLMEGLKKTIEWYRDHDQFNS
ncbi:MAG: sugar dehydratase [Bacteriovoracaceae bacterium]|nr:sugar dehydratase [Bacteriovoracaceae bacterium]